MREKYVVELAQTVNELFSGGTTDPSADEIAQAHFPGKALGGEIVDGVRKRLRRIREVLEQDFELPVYLLNHIYYTRYRNAQPKTQAEARRCIPGGWHVSAAGIRLNQDGDSDLIWQAMMTQNVISGSGKVKKSVDRTLDAVEDGRLSARPAAELMETARRTAQPTKGKLAAKVMRSLPK